MSVAERLRNSYLRIDARSLGLFRVFMGLALIGDLCVRWSSSKAFYSNEGVVSNHAHLFHALKQEPPVRVWSVFHAISTAAEAKVALFITFIIYCLFLVGYKTRVFHVISLLLLISLTGRDLLIEGPANYVAIALLAATAFLPCGSRFSMDSLSASFKREREKDATALNDRARPPERQITAERSAGWSPTSLAALAALLHIAVIYYAIARQQSGAGWKDGTALHYALWVERWVSDIGLAARAAPPALLKGWSYLLRYIPFTVPALALLPVPRYTRLAACALSAFYGLSYGLLFDFGLWGWTLLAASFLLLDAESWDAALSRFAKGRALTVIYDADCGICLWLARLLKRLDIRGHLTFQGNDALTILPGQKPPYRSPAEDGDEEPARVVYRRKAPGAPLETAPLPAEVTDKLVTETIVAVDETGRVFTEGAAVVRIVRSLPLGAVLSLPLHILGALGLVTSLYRVIAPRRIAISEALGLAACGVPLPAAPAAAEPSSPAEVAPAVRLRRVITGAARETLAVVLFLVCLAQTARNNPWPATLTVPPSRFFTAVADWTRMQARYSVIAPDAPQEDGVFVVDGQTSTGKSIDPMTGREPSLNAPRFRLGLLWSDFTAAMRKKEHSDFERSFRDYLVKGGPAWRTDIPENRVMGFDAYWMTYKSPPPGGGGVEITGRDKLFSYSRGGQGTGILPILKTPMIR